MSLPQSHTTTNQIPNQTLNHHGRETQATESLRPQVILLRSDLHCQREKKPTQGKWSLLLPSVVSWLIMMQIKPSYGDDSPDLVDQPFVNA